MKQKRIIPYFYLLLAVGLLVVFMYYPIIRNIIYSLVKWNLFSGTKKFIGFSNYLNLFKDETFYVALLNNIRYIIISLIFQVGIALIFSARIVQMRHKKIAVFLRTVYFIPSLMSLTIIGLLFSFVYKTDGLLNSILTLLSGVTISKGWLGDAHTSIYAVIAVSQWKSIGYTMLLLIVGMQRIPVEIYEATKIDGASQIVTFRKVTVPLVSDIIKIAIIINITGALLVFNEIFVMTNGGPHGTSEVLSTIMYKNAFVYGKVGYASAISIIILLLSMIFLMIQVSISNKAEEE